jgi:hypothetical protein
MIRKIVKDPNRRPLRTRHRARTLTAVEELIFLKSPQDAHKTPQDIHKEAQEAHKTPEDGPRGLQDHPKTAQDTPKTAQDPPKTVQGASKTRFWEFFGIKMEPS